MLSNAQHQMPMAWALTKPECTHPVWAEPVLCILGPRGTARAAPCLHSMQVTFHPTGAHGNTHTYIYTTRCPLQ